MMVNPPYSQHLKGDRSEDDRNEDDWNKEGDRSRSDRNKDNRHIEEEDKAYKEEDKGAGRGEAHKDGRAGLGDVVKGEGGVRRSRGQQGW